MENRQTLLWLDDTRNPFDKPDWLVFSPIEEPYELVWAKNYKEFVHYIERLGLPTAICFDHDLAIEHIEDHVQQKEVVLPGTKIHPTYHEFVERTGYDCAKWLVDYCIDNDEPLPLYNIQSANPVGKENIDGLLKNFIKYQNNEKNNR